jgi:hypothetical protein
VEESGRLARMEGSLVWKAHSYGRLTRMEGVLTGNLNTRHAPHLEATTSADFFASKEVQAKRCKQRGASKDVHVMYVASARRIALHECARP